MKNLSKKFIIYLKNRIKQLCSLSYYAKNTDNLNNLEFHLTEKCNYKCEYCFSHSLKDIHAENNTVDSFIKLVSGMQEKSKIKLIGGEPLFHPRFMELAHCIMKHNHDLRVGTNFSFPNKLFEKIIDESKREKQISLVVSLHLTQINSIDSFIEKVIELKKYGDDKIEVSVVSVLKEDNFEKLLNVKEKLALSKIPMVFQRLKVNSGKEFLKYEENIEAYLMENFPNRVAAKIEFLNPFGMLCKTGYSFIRIYVNGEISRCYNYQEKLFSLGNINGNWKLLKKSMPCLSDKCTCLLPVAQNLLEFEKYDRKLANKILAGK